MTTADALRELAKELRKGSGGASASKDWNNGYLAGMEEAAKRIDKAAAAMDGAKIVPFPWAPVQTWKVDAPPEATLTFKGIPVVFNENMEADEMKLYRISVPKAPK